MTALLFWASLIFVLYTYALYPLLILIAARLAGHPPAARENDPLPPVTMIVVAFDEESRIEAKLENIAALDYPVDRFRAIVVSDGSTDRTGEILRGRGDIEAIVDDTNRGKPAQLNRALASIEEGIVVFSDVRQMWEPGAVRALVRNFADPAVGAVSGELVFRRAGEETGESIGLYWRYEKLLRRAESDVDSTLGVTGAIYAARRELILPIPDDTILDDVEIPLQGFRRGYRVVFEPAAVAWDDPADAIAHEFRRKTRTLAGNYQTFARNLWLLDPRRDRIFPQAVSHKLFRLLVPWALLLLLFSSALMPRPLFRAFFWAQAACWVAGAAASFMPALRRNRLFSFLSVFVSLNAAAVAGLFRWAAGRADARWKR
ncbi:MAG: glycosyltransferase family 2 protein [Candidatus Krumholzibacteriota bacterium]|nr:glycosyltransferase family 2 protein [Candidatus Krumholzibacteriota bacterium]